MSIPQTGSLTVVAMDYLLMFDLIITLTDIFKESYITQECISNIAYHVRGHPARTGMTAVDRFNTTIFIHLYFLDCLLV
jgi:hypothetical protein